MNLLLLAVVMASLTNVGEGTDSDNDDTNSSSVKTKSLCELLEELYLNDEVVYKTAEALIANKTCDINEHGGYLDETPLMICAARSDYRHSPHYRLLVTMLQSRRDIDVNRVDCLNRSALHFACMEMCHPAIWLLLKRDDCDISLQIFSDVFQMFLEDYQIGSTPLHVYLRNITHRYFEHDDIIATFRLFMRHHKAGVLCDKIDNYKCTVLDTFLWNSTIHSYDLELKPEFMQMLEILLSKPETLHASNQTLAIAAAYACPSVFVRLLKAGACANYSLPNNETTLHIVVYKNSVAKFKSILDQNGSDLQVCSLKEWNFLTPIRMARLYECNAYIVSGLTGNQDQETSSISKVESSKESILSDWRHVKRITSTTIHTHVNRAETNEVLVFIVKNNRALMTKYQAEVDKIRSSLKAFLIGMNNYFSQKTSDYNKLVFESVLSGSMADRTRCNLPDEWDFTCILTKLTSDDDPREVAQEFYGGCAAFCHEYNTTLANCETGISQCLFQYMEKISRLRLRWKGGFFDGLVIYVDLVPALSRDHVIHLPLDVQMKEQLIAKISRRNFIENDGYARSYVVPECEVVRSLPQHIRDGLIIAKSMRVSSICQPGVKMNQLGIVEDLEIEDYISSHLLKECLLLLLQSVYFLSDEQYTSVTTMMNKYNNCKYIWADLIYHILQNALIEKRLFAWHFKDSDTLFDCKICKSHWVCCQKREIKLALVKQIRLWLRDNIEGLHGGERCDCKYEGQDTDSVEQYLARLQSTGAINDNAHKYDYSDHEKLELQMVSSWLVEYVTEKDTVLRKLHNAQTFLVYIRR